MKWKPINPWAEADKDMASLYESSDRLKEPKKIIPGQFETVKDAYGGHRSQVMSKYLSNGWAVKSIAEADYKSGNIYFFYTFEAGQTAEEVSIDLPNAHKI